MGIKFYPSVWNEKASPLNLQSNYIEHYDEKGKTELQNETHVK